MSHLEELSSGYRSGYWMVP